MLNTVSEAPKPRTSLKAGIQMAQKDILKEQRKQIERLKRSFINYVVSSEFFSKVLSVFTSPLPREHIYEAQTSSLFCKTQSAYFHTSSWFEL